MIPYLRIQQAKYSLKQDEVAALDFDSRDISFASLVIVFRDDDVLMVDELREGFPHKFPVEGVRVVEVIGADILEFFIPIC